MEKAAGAFLRFNGQRSVNHMIKRIFFGLMVILSGCSGKDSNTASKTKDSVAVKELNVEQILGWGQDYNKYLGVKKEIILKEFGKPYEEAENGYNYSKSSRFLHQVIFSLGKSNTVVSISIIPNTNERFDANKVLMRPSMFKTVGGANGEGGESISVGTKSGEVFTFSVNKGLEVFVFESFDIMRPDIHYIKTFSW